ncbi:quinol:cytochrome C oxidoreductase [Mucilaginibacter arboris]|uniref:Quinol:cytochrome C oxidoreductase n=1 Tax=Mucilaginibacter arboris TaxID=2682090 RepID=A0A7K1SUX9_9SPHI|nr:quinol:cytochrome C oxidoreductase [Mucilaginibacter arboris]MVN21149.1 quinol:cytochrome C oxidoreductase [Mucilaginibacter arboris]
MKAINYDQQFEFSGKAKTYSLIAIAIGLLAILFGLLTGQTERIFANLLLMSYYFACVCMAGVLFCAIQYVSQAGWSSSILRVPQAFAKVLPYASLFLIAIITIGLFTNHSVIEEGKKIFEPNLYAQWATKGVTIKGSGTYNAEVAAKAGYLNIPFFLARLVIFLILYSIIGLMLVKYSRKEDELGGMSNYNKSFGISAVFLAIFGFTYPVFAFDAIMSLEAHYYFSTLFGWYNFAAMWVSGLALIALVVIILRQNGYMDWVTENHLHDMGKLVFAFSIFWTYLWFAQLLLTYYANIPEETVYYYERWEPEFKPWFWLNIVLNFCSPVLLLMSRDAKRAPTVLKYVCIVVLCGHWLDYYLMVMPGTVGAEGRGFGVEEVGIALGFVGLFTFLMLNALSKVSLIPKKHPFLEESLNHHI